MAKTPRTGTGALALVLLLAGAALLLARQEAAADDSLMIGIDMSAGPATTTFAGVTDTCTVVEAGDTFEADIFVTNALDLMAWELRVDYDPNVVSLDSADYDHLLTQSGGQIFPSLFEQDKPGRMFMAAADVESPDSGSGVLARLHWTALKDGASEITIASTPSYLGPRLVSAGGVFFGDSNGDGIWDGHITGGKVAVGGLCAGSVPVTTPPSSLPVEATATPGSDGGSNASGGDAPGGDAPGPGGGQEGGAPGPGEPLPGAPSDDGSPATEDASTPEPFAANDQGDEEDGDPPNDMSGDDALDAESDGGERGSSSNRAGGSGPAFPALMIAAVVGALGLMVLGTFALVVGRRS